MDAYAILEVTYSATDEEIKKSFRRLSMLYHPDRPGGNEEKYKKITAAYAELQKRPKQAPRQERKSTNVAYGFGGGSWRVHVHYEADIRDAYAQAQRDMTAQRDRMQNMQETVAQKQKHFQDMLNNIKRAGL